VGEKRGHLAVKSQTSNFNMERIIEEGVILNEVRKKTEKKKLGKTQQVMERTVLKAGEIIANCAKEKPG